MTKHTSLFINPFSSDTSYEERLFFWLRFSLLGCFVGHGFWGLVTKKGWIPFFEVFFIDSSTAFALMPLVGIMDIMVGIIAFVYPTRALLLWASFWTLFTAALRPSAGMGMSEFFERAGNFGVPLLFLGLYGIPSTFHYRQWFTKLKPLSDLTFFQGYFLECLMRLSLLSLLVGHGGLCVFMKHQVVARNLSILGITEVYGLQYFGLFEIALGLVACLKPRLSWILPFVCVYKLTFELLFPVAGVPMDIFETIERMGDYIIPIILLQYYRSAYYQKGQTSSHSSGVYADRAYPFQH